MNTIAVKPYNLFLFGSIFVGTNALYRFITSRETHLYISSKYKINNTFNTEEFHFDCNRYYVTDNKGKTFRLESSTIHEYDNILPPNDNDPKNNDQYEKYMAMYWGIFLPEFGIYPKICNLVKMK